MSINSRSNGRTDEETCFHCGHTGEPVVHEQRINRAGPSNAIAILVQCSECGYQLH